MPHYAKVHSAQINGLEASLIDIEVDVMQGLHSFSIVGLADIAVSESKDRVSAAIRNSGYTSPKKKNQKVVVSLAPADIRKEEPVFDVGIALAYLLAVGDICFDPGGKVFLGELSLDGSLRPIRGTLALARHAEKHGFKELYVPLHNAQEAALIEGIRVFPIHTLSELINHLQNTKQAKVKPLKTSVIETPTVYHTDFSDIKGQESAKRGLEIAAAGGHNIALYGPPGTGKTMLARAFLSILPSLSFHDMLEVTSIHSIAGTLTEPIITTPPFRAPHHTSSYVSMVGGGSYPKPGEITLAHKGVLFTDEFPEFDSKVIETLRQPLEDKVITISRAKRSVTFPAHFILIAALNPCPCGYRGSDKACICKQHDIERYKRKLSGPIVDRIDMWVEVSRIDHEKLTQHTGGETSASIKKRVIRAREKQKMRFKDMPNLSINSDMTAREIQRYIYLHETCQHTLNKLATGDRISARAYHRVIKLARTIADLKDQEDIEIDDILEAFQYRPKAL